MKFEPGNELFEKVKLQHVLIQTEFSESTIIVRTSEPFSEADKELWIRWLNAGYPSRKVEWIDA